MTDNPQKPSTLDDDEEFKDLERRFVEFIQTLENDKTHEHIRKEYNNLYNVLMRSRANERKFAAQIKELNNHIIEKTADIEKLSQNFTDEQQFVTSLNKQIERAHKSIQQYEMKEAMANETILLLKKEISNLSSLVQQDSGVSLGQENTVKDLLKEKEELVLERDNQVQEMIELRNMLQEKTEKIRVLQQEKLQKEHEIHQLESEVAARKAENDRQIRRKEKLDMDLKRLHEELELANNVISERQQTISDEQSRINSLEGDIKREQTEMEHRVKELDLLNQRTRNLQKELEQQEEQNRLITEENQKLSDQLNSKQRENRKLESEKNKLERQKMQLENKILDVQNKKREAEGKQIELNNQITSVKREKTVLEQHLHKNSDNIKTLNSTINQLNDKSRHQDEIVHDTKESVLKLENTLKQRKHEIATQKKIIEKQQTEMSQLEQARNKLNQQASDAKAKQLQGEENLRIGEANSIELKKQIEALKQKTKTQANLYESVRSERNLYSKQLVESRDQIMEMRRKFNILNHQIKQLKEENQSKDNALSSVQTHQLKIEKERDTHKNELQKIKEQCARADALVHAQDAEITKLLKIINEADSDRLKQKKLFEEIMNERDILGTQLIRRNDELALLYEKIKIQQSILAKGEVQYQQRVKDIVSLRKYVVELRRQIDVLKKSNDNAKTLRNQVFRLQKELLNERNRCRALAEELSNPVNIHRWRQLEGSDPDMFALIQKVHQLQKRLISKSQEVITKDLMIEEKEKLFAKLKQILSKLPGPEVSDQLNAYQKEIETKKDQMKAMSSELRQYRTSIEQHRNEIENLSKEMNEIKSKYYKLKKKEDLKGQQRHERVMTEQLNASGMVGTMSGMMTNTMNVDQMRGKPLMNTESFINTESL
eukprot:TRINITY_DN3097_c1_g1_i1.p1 TRINITY_DN3097_c1_g1~~TRINITY_DN3097_c1_g1_i1.p1  ORF type:complete len:907 (+),score=264.66 TRINITY_DN3097_c1_g1_i1:53-2722(+)